MERAVKAVLNSFILNRPDLFSNKDFAIFCGMGNNGGDGLALVRLLLNKGKNVLVFILKHKDEGSPDFERNLLLLKRMTDSIHFLDENKLDFKIQKDHVLIDCILGTGLSRPVSGFLKKIIVKINSLKNPLVAIDSPSGLSTENNGSNDLEAVIKADCTFTIGTPKLSFFFPSNQIYTGHWFLVTIGLDQQFLESADSRFYFLEEKDITSHIKARSPFSHKGTYGHALIIAGSYGKIGAAVLSTKACLRTGAGLVTAVIPKCGYEILQSSVPEAMVITSEKDDELGKMELSQEYSSTAIGPGIGTSSTTSKLLESILGSTKASMVLDADALNIIAANPEYLKKLPPDSILTPHPGEFKRLVGSWKNDHERLDLLINFAVKHHVLVILKGKYSTLACPTGEVYFNSTGNPGMATAGSGDVLTGMLCSFLAQGYEAKTAALMGMYLHGLAGDKAVEKKGENSILAGDIIEGISGAFSKF